MPAGVYDYIPQERIVFGRPAAEAIRAEAERLGKTRLFLVTAKSLNRKTPAIGELRAALGRLVVGLYDDCIAHTPRETVVACAEAVRQAGADMIVTIGGGTAIDMVKAVQICLAEDVRTVEGLDDWHTRVNPDGSYHTPRTKPSPVRQIIVPTTLSGAEFSTIAGVTDTRTHVKEGYVGTDAAGQAVILDAAITVHTPEWLWLSTGVRGLDHAVEGICSIRANPFITGCCRQAIEMFAAALPRTKADPQDLDARLACQQATWIAGHGIDRAPYGASHGIGGVLGGLKDVPHGYTSCILLPHVLRWNRPATEAQQRYVSAAFGHPDADAADLVADFVGRLGLPQRLRDVGVSRDDFPAIARRCRKNMWVLTNPRPLPDDDAIMALLEAAY
ncbi:MAG: iron-containing alcohol dehydrogenase [Alphaproteobacteria bacterium]|nr:iron-containing alcohol dehydrogenase [Alphaproteobacteria bacterium]